MICEEIVKGVDMKLEIRGRHVEINEVIRAYAERRLSFALDRFAERIKIVRLTVGDVNSSRGGVDKHCQIAVSFMYSSPITIESCDSTVQGAIDRVFSKVGSLVARHFGRNRERRRSTRLARQLFESPFVSMATFLGEGRPS